MNTYRDIVHATRTGNLKKFNEAMMTYLDIFIKKGTYLVLEKVKTLVYRNLIKTVAKLEDNKVKLSKVIIVLLIHLYILIHIFNFYFHSVFYYR